MILGEQPFTMHPGSSLLYALMHKCKVDTQDANGTQLWVFDTNRRKRVARLVLPVEATSVHASQEAEPRLFILDKDGKLHIYDGHQLKLQRTIEKPGTKGWLQALATHDCPAAQPRYRGRPCTAASACSVAQGFGAG